VVEEDPDRPPFVSIVVTVKDSVKALPTLLADFEALDWPSDGAEVVLVDAFSTDGTWQLVEEWARTSRFHVVAAQRKGRIGAGRNEGFRRAAGALVAVTDADMRVPAQWLMELVAGMDDPEIGVVGGPNDSAADDLVSRAIACVPVHGPSLGEVPVLGRSRYRQDFTTDEDIYACVTRNSLFRREAFEGAGGFDESLVATEDPELNQRILKAGYKLRYRKAAGVRHIHRDSLGAFYRQQKNYAIGQAHANRSQPEMRSVKQAAPAIAAFVFVLSSVIAVVDVRFFWVAGAVGGAAVLFVVFYAVKAAVVRRDPALLVALPWFVLAWQLAWVVGFPKGQWSRPHAD
jgi:cellulose synthase/poly-beta-1,6-N-acetylglucosamine synthase-like glycosyltransferase